MMRLTRIAALAVLAASLSIGAGHSQSLRNGQTPAEFPPDSFKGTQYVDSNGCVFIRAGIDGNVTWVPRVNRQRQLICGQTPTLSADAAASARATPRQSTQGSPEQITIAPSSTETATAPQPAPAPRPAARTVQSAPAPATTRPSAPAPRVTTRAPAAAATAQASAPSCDGASAVSTRYINSGQNGVVRCGPQTAAGATQTPQGTTQQTAIATAPTPEAETEANIAGPLTRVVPRHVFENRALKRPSRIPEGYEPVWDDDRLNPRRAEQSLNGIAQTRLAWTNTVPRRLIDRSTGRDVTARVPLVFPYTDIDTQERNLGRVTLIRQNGQIVKQVQRKPGAKARQPVVSTRSANAPLTTTRAAQARYVQVGTFGVPSNAQAAAQRIARAGLPARIGKVTRRGKSYQVVLAGPFTTTADLSSGLQRSRAVGFSDAFVRK